MYGDWWFGGTDPAGNVLDDAAGVPQAGALAGRVVPLSYPRAGNDYLFGVPAASCR